MRPKVLLVVLIVAGAIVGFAVWLRTPAKNPVAEAPPSPSEISSAQPAAPAAPAVTAPPAIAPREPRHDVPPSVEVSDSVTAILTDLQKPDWKTRQAALQRARELDDRSLVPRLQQIADNDNDAREKADILDTINYLNLPDISENMAAAANARAAQGLPNPPQSPTNRWTGQPFRHDQ